MKNLYLSLIISLMTISGFAQQTEIVGKVVNEKNKEPLFKATIELLGTNLSSQTNQNGEFSLNNPVDGQQYIIVKKNGYITKTVPVIVEGMVDMGTITLEEDQNVELQLSLVTLTESDLGDDNSSAETTSGILQASRDQYEQIAAFNWGQARFRIRNLDIANANIMINGISMNRAFDGRPQFANWGGLNDVMRNQEFTAGSADNDYSFGDLLGVQFINARASQMRPGNRVSFMGSNINYNWRTMVTHNSGLTKSGWAYSLSASYRGADQAYFEGTDYDAASLFLAIEKKFNDKHSLNLTAIYGQNSRGKNSPNTQEVIDLKGYRYNSFWGWQNGVKRNSRYKNVEEPIFILSHHFKINENTRLNTNVAYQFGHIENTRLNFNGGTNPDPTYYKNLPSYFMNLHSNTTPAFWTPDWETAELVRQDFVNNGQIDWEKMYHANRINGRAIYSLFADVMADRTLTANTYFSSQITKNIGFNAGINYRNIHSENYQKMLDLLGNHPAVDDNMFFNDDFGQSDLNNRNRLIYKNDRFGYNYIIRAQILDAFTQFKFKINKLNLYFSQMASYTEYEREGLYKNGLYPDNSLGKGQKLQFNNYGIKGGGIYKIKGSHIVTFNATYFTKAPNIRNSFPNARINNIVIDNLTNETLFGGDVNYIIRLPKFKGRIGAYYNEILNASQVSFFFADGIDVNVSGRNSMFVSEVAQGINKRNMGIELGAEYQITPTVKLIGGMNLSESIYSDNATVYLNADGRAIEGLDPKVPFGTSYIKNYKTPDGPQKAYSLGIEYRDPKYWWIGADANLLTDLYLNISPVMRTSNFFAEPGQNGASFPNIDTNISREMLKQERLNDIFLLNIKGGKSWRVKRNTLGVFAVINNVLNQNYKTGGFEQARNANYKELSEDLASGTRTFGPKYFYGFGRTFLINIYYNF